MEKGWIPQRAESWTNDSSHIPRGFEAWSFQRCLTALGEDVPPNFNWHLIYLRSFKTLPFTIRHQPKASLLFWNMRCLRVDSSLAVNHIHQALENASPVRWPSTTPCTEFHHPKFLSSWNQLTLFFLIKPTYRTEVSFFAPKSGTFPTRCKVQYLFTLLDKQQELYNLGRRGTPILAGMCSACFYSGWPDMSYP